MLLCFYQDRVGRAVPPLPGQDGRGPHRGGPERDRAALRRV